MTNARGECARHAPGSMRRTLCAWVVLVVCLVPAGRALAGPDLATLAQSPRWQALLHINTGATWRGVGRSYVDDPDFFLAEHGASDPVAELRASVRALRPRHSDARCRYPARYRFLATQLGWQERAPLAHCQAYREWREHMPTGQLVLVFPAAYLNSPSSMFGHTLLRLDATPDPDSVWLSRAINFGARTDAQDNSLFYIWRGLGGGYPGRFSVVPYVEKIRDYAFIENRDMWEYALDLDADELDWLVRHLWELRDVNFDYYFFDENCSFRLLELIAVARPQAQLMNGKRFAELPVHTVRTLYDADMVVARRYRPSKAKQLAHRAAALTAAQRGTARALMRDPQRAERPAFTALDPATRHRIAQVAYDALRLAHREGERDADVARRSLALLRIVQRNPAPPADPVPTPDAPETGHGTQMASLGAGHGSAGDFMELGYRLTYHDMLDPTRGFLPGAAIEGLDLRLRATEGQGLDLESLDLVNIRSLAPRGAFRDPVSWFVHAGMAQMPTDGDRQLGAFVQGGPGASWRYGRLMPYAFAVARLESVAGMDPDLSLGGGTEVGAVVAADRLQLGAHLRVLYYTGGYRRLESGVALNVPLAKQHALRADCGYEQAQGTDIHACRIAWRHFFD